MANPVKTAQQLRDIAERYNQACIDYNDAKNMHDSSAAALAGVRAAEALSDYTGVKIIVTPGNIGDFIKQADKFIPDSPNSSNINAPYNIDDPLVYKEWGIKPPPKDDKGGTCPTIPLPTKSWWENAKAVLPPRRDPLTLDLDGDGLETTGVAATNPILFDHDGDGIKNGTGWVNADDGFLVRDVNGNGSIDSGRELFGDSTIKSNGQLATDGFDALADLDSISNGGNADGRISSADAQFANLRVWRDLNQDGISQSNELFTLSSQNIASINVTKTANSQTLANGNQIADLGSFTRTDGSTGTAGAVTGNLADINLASDTFHRSFPNELDTTSVATLPDMQGSGKVRDLREAATQSTTLQTLLTQYSAATTRVQQTTLIDQLLDAWADTGGMAESMAQRVAAMTGYTRADGVVIPYTLSSNLSADWVQKLHIIETFNGSYFFGLPGTTQTAGAVTGLSIATPTATSTSVQITANFNQQQLDLLQQSYDAIKGSVYDALLLQTRFKPLLDQINLVIDSTGIRLNYNQIYTSLISKCLPQASAYLRKVASDGECLRLPSEASTRAKAGCETPMRLATSAWVSPALCRASSNTSNAANSSLSASHSTRNSGFFKSRAKAALWSSGTGLYGKSQVSLLTPTGGLMILSMFNLLQTFTRQQQISHRGFRCFFNKHMQNHNLLINQTTKQSPSNTITPMGAYFKQTRTHSTCVRQTQICAMLNHTRSNITARSQHISRPAIHFYLQVDVKIMDAIHASNYNNYVINRQAANDWEWKVKA